ncbi:MAG: HEPN domain-containing protein [Desulfobacterales bacterium]|nr:HEPN domain-containing protein [Desulfobacterales bacterium]
MKAILFKKAKNNLMAAQLCYDNGFYDGCANRAYYAGFQASIAALIHRGIKRDKIDHKLVQADFSEQLIKRQKIYPAKLKSYLMDMQLIRNRADYTHESISQKLALLQISKAKEMMELIGKDIEKCA